MKTPGLESSPDTAIRETTGGNYFVSNYPPFSHWSPDCVGQAFEVIDRPPEPETPLGVYLHIPFCRKRCHFCYFRVYTDKNSSDIHAYLEALIREAELYAQKPLVEGRSAEFIYFGGGTPSYLSPRQLRRLVDGFPRALGWDAVKEMTFECEPGTLSEDKLRMIREIGVTRLSLGVENFDDLILEQNNRAHRSREIHRAYDWARSVNFPQINIDLIAGMIGETEENWSDCVERAIAMDPDSVTLYQMEVPYNTTIYKTMRTEGVAHAPVADWPTKRRWVSEGFDRLAQAGYTVSSGYTAVRDSDETQFVYRDSLWHGADMLGLGVASFGYVGGAHVQNEKDFGAYIARLNAEELPIHRAYIASPEEKLIRELILQLKLGRVSRRYFQEKFSVDIQNRFAEPLDRLERASLLSVKDDTLELSRDGLIQVDGLLPAFFLPEHQEKHCA